MFRDYSECREKRKRAIACYVLAGLLALVDLSFNVLYMMDATGNLALSLLSGVFFTGLLVALAILLGNTYEYSHYQLKEAKKSGEHPPSVSNYDPNQLRRGSDRVGQPSALSVLSTGPTQPNSGPIVQSELVLKPVNRAVPLELTRTITVGRKPENVVVIRVEDHEDENLRRLKQSVSGQHAKLEWNGQAWQVTDLGSANGTFVAGRQLSAHETAVVPSGTVIRFGLFDTELR
jgi:hypothetical protein